MERIRAVSFVSLQHGIDHQRMLLVEFLDIGKEIKCFVEEQSVGAVSWRRTGVYTFDGNKPIRQKVTYQQIREHLQSVYKCKIMFPM